MTTGPPTGSLAEESEADSLAREVMELVDAGYLAVTGPAHDPGFVLTTAGEWVAVEFADAEAERERAIASEAREVQQARHAEQVDGVAYLADWRIS